MPNNRVTLTFRIFWIYKFNPRLQILIVTVSTVPCFITNKVNTIETVTP